MSQLNLNDDDVVDMMSAFNFARTYLSTFAQLKQGLRELVQPVSTKWLDNGVECKILRTTGGGWQKGKLRLRIEFVPDEPEAPQSSDIVLSPKTEQ